MEWGIKCESRLSSVDVLQCFTLNCIIQVVYINGIDVNGMLHEHVVNLIRQSRDTGNGELTLTVRPNVLYNALAGTDETSEEEPPYR